MYEIYKALDSKGFSLVERFPWLVSVCSAAVGPSTGGRLGSHPTSNAFTGVVNFASGTTTGGTATDVTDSKVTAHALLMIIGWGLVLPFGVVFARCKEWGQIWFQLHRAFQVLPSLFFLPVTIAVMEQKICYQIAVCSTRTGFNLTADLQIVDILSWRCLLNSWLLFMHYWKKSSLARWGQAVLVQTIQFMPQIPWASRAVF